MEMIKSCALALKLSLFPPHYLLSVCAFSDKVAGLLPVIRSVSGKTGAELRKEKRCTWHEDLNEEIQLLFEMFVVLVIK